VSYFFGWGNKVQYSVTGTDGRVRRAVDIEVGASPMMHDFSLTARHVVIYDLPVTFDLDLVAQAASGSFVFPYAWDPNYPARVGVLSRETDGSDVRWFDVEPCYVYHPLNAYEDGSDRIVLDVVRHPKMFASDRHGPNEGPPTLDRWTIDLSGDKVLEERIDDRGQEFPRVDERLTGRPHRFGYAPAVGTDAGDIDLTGSLLKHDLVAGRTDVRSFGPAHRAGEFVFVPSGSDAAEDEGVLMGFVHDDQAARTDLVLLDAGTLEDVARVHIPARIPYGFHGNWIPA
jgi:carotenoid cleavage oxygenase